MRIASWGHAIFAAILIALSIPGLIQGDFTAIWQPVPTGIPARELLVYLCASLSLAAGIGLLFRGSAALAACVLLAVLIAWFLLWRVRAHLLVPLGDHRPGRQKHPDGRRRPSNSRTFAWLAWNVMVWSAHPRSAGIRSDAALA